MILDEHADERWRGLYGRTDVREMRLCTDEANGAEGILSESHHVQATSLSMGVRFVPEIVFL